MIAHLRGTLLEKRPNYALLDVGGVGYAVNVAVSAYSELPEPGGGVTLHVYTHVREDALALYGFLRRSEKELFEKLITVNGVGPRLAVTILSGLPADELLTAIRAGDAKSLTRIPGVGRKTGERIILELREKLGSADRIDGAPQPAGPSAAVEQDVISAMLNLGCSAELAERSVQRARKSGIPPEFDPLFRRALEIARG